MRSVIVLSLLATLFVVSACNQANKEPEQKEESVMPVQDTVFGDMVGTMDKARGVESTLQQHVDDVNTTIDQETQTK